MALSLSLPPLIPSWLLPPPVAHPPRPHPSVALSSPLLSSYLLPPASPATSEITSQESRGRKYSYASLCLPSPFYLLPPLSPAPPPVG